MLRLRGEMNRQDTAMRREMEGRIRTLTDKEAIALASLSEWLDDNDNEKLARSAEDYITARKSVEEGMMVLTEFTANRQRINPSPEESEDSTSGT